MRAVVVREFGGPEQLRLGEVANLVPGPGQVLVTVHACFSFHGVLVQDDGERTRALAALLDAGVLRPVVSHVLPLAAAAEAHRILESGHSGGKIILDVAGS